MPRLPLSLKKLIVGLAVLGMNPVQLWAGECLLKPLKPVRISGALCGTVGSIDNGDRLSGAEVVLRDASGVLVASVNADADATFTFPRLPKGKYQIEVPGFSFLMKDAVIVYPGLHSCSGGYVSRKWDFKRFPDGPPSRNR